MDSLGRDPSELGPAPKPLPTSALEPQTQGYRNGAAAYGYGSPSQTLDNEAAGSGNTLDQAKNWRFSVIIGSLFFGTFLVALDTTIIGTATPAITTTFHALDDIAWYGSGYLLTLTALQPTFGKLYTMFNVKGIYLACIGIFEAGSILCATSPSSTTFIVGRAMQGCGAAGILQGALVVITNAVPLEKRPFYISLVISAFGLCVKIGPLLGGTFTERTTWRWCFWINAPIGAIVMALIFLFLRLEPKHKPEDSEPVNWITKLRRVDAAGTVLVIASICCLLLALQWGGQKMPWRSSKVIGLLVGSGLSLISFFLIQWKTGNDGTLPFPILKQRSIISGALYLFTMAIPTYIYGFYVPIYFQSVRGYNALRSGIDFLALALPQIGFTVLSGWLASKFGYYTPYLVGGTAISVAGSGLFILLHPDTPLANWVLFFLTVAVGTGLSINHPYTAVQAVLDDSDVPVGNAIMQFTFSLGGALSLCIAQTIFTNRLMAEVKQNISGILPEQVLAAGAYGLSKLASDSPEVLFLLRVSYNNSLKNVWAFALAAGGLAFMFSLFFEHHNLKNVAERRRQACSDHSKHGKLEQAA